MNEGLGDLGDNFLYNKRGNKILNNHKVRFFIK